MHEGTTVTPLNKKGRTIDFTFPNGTKPRTVTIHPFIKSASASYCVTLNYTAQPDLEWKSVEDTNDDYLIDSDQLKSITGKIVGEQRWPLGIQTLKVNWYKNENTH